MLTAAAVLVVACVGVWCMLSLPVDSFPDVSNVQVQVITEPESMATEEVEQLVTFPIEMGLNGLPGIKQIRSNSSFGFSIVTAIFDDNIDVYWARNIIDQKLGQLDLPDGVPKPHLGPVISTFSNVFDYYLSSDKYDLTELRTLQDWVIARKLRSLSGVGNIISYGGFVKQYQVVCSPVMLKSYGLDVSDLATALKNNNTNAGGNFIEQGGEEIIIRGLGRIETIEDISDIVLKSVHGTPVKVGQVAEIKIGPAFRRGSASRDGQGETVVGQVLIRKGANTKAVVERVKERFAEIKKDLPADVKLTVYYDQTLLVDKTIDTVKEILLFTGALVIIILTAILLDVRTSLIVSVVIPLSLLFSFILMKVTGLSANLMTLGAVDFGVIVDASVVMVENIFRRLAEASEHPEIKKDTLKIVRDAAKEVGRPIVFAISIIIAVYLPLFALEGIEGRMFHPLALTFVYALVGALLFSLTIVPVLCYWFMHGKVVERHNPVVEAVRSACLGLLAKSMRAPQVTLTIAAAALVATFCLVPFLGSEFLPKLDEGTIVLRTKLSPSVAHTESRRIATVVEKIIQKFPEVDSVVSLIGRSGMGADTEGIDTADVYISLKPHSAWKTAHTKEELINKMAGELSQVPGLIYSFSQPIANMVDDLVAGIKSELGIKIFGDNLETIDKLSAQVEAVVANVPGAADMQREHILGLPQLNIKLKRNVIARYGLNVSDVQELIETAIAGRVVTDVMEDTKRFGLLVRFNESYRDTPEDIASILIDTPSGARVPIKQLADVTLERGTVMVNREDGQRRTAVMANVRGRDLGSFVKEGQERVAKQVRLPQGYSIVWGGQFENQQRAMARLSVVVPVVLLLIFVLLFASFNSVRNAALIMLNVPFAMIGGIIALFVTHNPISVPAIIGFIALFGVAVQNGVIMVSYIMQLQKQGVPVREAAFEGASVRLRPVLMTALVAIVGLLPKIISTGTGAEIQRPLALVVLGGLVSATVLTLIVLPTVYPLINKPKVVPTKVKVQETESVKI